MIQGSKDEREERERRSQQVTLKGGSRRGYCSNRTTLDDFLEAIWKALDLANPLFLFGFFFF